MVCRLKAGQNIVMIMRGEYLYLYLYSYLYLYLYLFLWDEYLQTCKLVQHPPALFFASLLQFISALCDYNAKDGDDENSLVV